MSSSTVDTVIIGAGQSGLAVSALLSAQGREHLVVDRGGAGIRWRAERWDSLRLLTPNWLTRLPGWSYDGPDPDGYMTAREVAERLERYAASFVAPIVTGEVEAALPSPRGGYDVHIDGATLRARSLVVATGAHARQRMPGALRTGTLDVLSSREYRSPRSLPPGGILIVGASATGVQLADELLRDGRRVIVAVGAHTRVPRTYQGMDVFWWLERLGLLSRTIHERGADRARHEPSLQLVGAASMAVDLPALQRRGARLVGRMLRLDGDVAYFDGGLPARTAEAHSTMTRLLDAVDSHVAGDALVRDLIGLRGQRDQRGWIRPARFIAEPGPERLQLSHHGVTSVLLATGLRPDYDWLRVPVVDADGYIVQSRGATPAPGLHVVGQPFQHRRDSTYIDGARWNARDVVASLTGQEATAIPPRHRAASRS
ncbi:NAD(P)-binding domain-containing protein [Microbacterium cremeum]|uniref:NAD(P)-binding domain-containing protein n=1 Tax=Microbacterium cremeum TaxID=2782169 RepID=UPI001888415F|nr:NAD(P)-binding domain-containing protein [Microbacterium cremeum]